MLFVTIIINCEDITVFYYFYIVSKLQTVEFFYGDKCYIFYNHKKSLGYVNSASTYSNSLVNSEKIYINFYITQHTFHKFQK